MRILVLVDGSKWSQKAALHAFDVAKRKGGKAKVVLYSVLDRREARAIAFHLGVRRDSVDEIVKFEERIWEETKRSVKEVMSVLLSAAAEEGINCSMKIVEGPAVDSIVREANSGYDLVVMGAFGKSGKGHIGSLLEDIVGSIEPPVMIVR
ncbi:MAG: universal stress protein [Thermococci archaeon]|nr:universal stress protein [Thermococci archaeon]